MSYISSWVSPSAAAQVLAHLWPKVLHTAWPQPEPFPQQNAAPPLPPVLLPQSAGQLLQFSAKAVQMPSPHCGTVWQQSAGQATGSSPASHLPLPHVAGQSSGQETLSSTPLMQTPSPHTGLQSAGQVTKFSVGGSHAPLPQTVT